MLAPKDDLTLLIDAARAAGEIAMKHRAAGVEAWDKPDDAGPLTKADLEIDQMLRETLGAARRDYGWLSEETPDNADRLERERVFIVDPIDGTRSFVEGSNAFCHSLAVVEAGRPVAGVVYLPALDRLYSAASGAGAFLNGAPLQLDDRDEITSETILSSRKFMGDTFWPGGPPPLKMTYRASFANRLALVGEGRFDAVVSFRDAWEWDIAAGVAIIEEAGGRVSDRNGQTMRLNSSNAQQAGIIGANALLHDELVARATKPAA